jgi:SurA N-terminal domain
MIKVMRDAAHNYPWLLKSMMGLLAVVFVITMGWWGFGEQTGNAVANVGDLTVSLDEFKRVHENMYRAYKEQNVGGEFKDEAFKQFVIEQMVDNRVWVIAAKEMGVTVSDSDLRALILQIPDFQKNGAFDPELYKRLLAANHLTPAVFEAAQHQEVLVNKARMIVRDSVALTPAEIAEGQVLMAKPQDSDPSKAAMAKDRVLQDMLFQKQQRAMVSYQQSLKTKIPITIHRERL